MKISASLQISFRRGKPFAAYLYLPRENSEGAATTEAFTDDLVVDYDENGRPIGIEIVSPGYVTTAEVKALLDHLKLDAALLAELTPVLADAPSIKTTA
jgi:uncharacterized protein YuzE